VAGAGENATDLAAIAGKASRHSGGGNCPFGDYYRCSDGGRGGNLLSGFRFLHG
jgi:hypothetical protein